MLIGGHGGGLLFRFGQQSKWMRFDDDFVLFDGAVCCPSANPNVRAIFCVAVALTEDVVTFTDDAVTFTDDAIALTDDAVTFTDAVVTFTDNAVALTDDFVTLTDVVVTLTDAAVVIIWLSMIHRQM